MTDPPTSVEHSRDYLRWNDSLAAHFFNPVMADRPVYLYTTTELVLEVGETIGSTFEDFIAAVQQGPPWVSQGMLCQRAIQATADWRARQLTYPPYVAYLGLFVLAAGTEADVAAHAYYPRLRRLLSYPDGGMLPSFDRMLELWSDLETWSNVDKGGSLGVFRAQIVGQWIHVGLPFAQTLLTEHERRVLPRMFFRAGLDPTSSPPTAELSRTLRRYGPGDLRPRTLRLLDDPNEGEMRDVLLNTVADELLEWDGQFLELNATSGSSVRCFAAARLCLDVDRVSNLATCRLRLKLNREFPDAPLRLHSSDLGSPISCEEFVGRWSTPLRCIDNGEINAGGLNWLEGVAFDDELEGWHFKLPGRPVRILTNGAGERLPGLVEIPALPRSAPFYLLYNNEVSEKVLPWLREECRDVREFANIHGLPIDWHLIQVGEAIRDSVRTHFPILSFSTGRRFRFSGGLRAFPGNNFFRFAPPDVVLDGKDGSEQVSIGGEILNPAGEVGDRYELPADLTSDVRIVIKVEADNYRIQRSLHIVSDFSWTFSEPIRRFDRWGLPLVEGSCPTGVAGVFVSGAAPDTSRFRRPVSFASHFDSSRATSRVFYIGRRQGEIVSWPAEPLPTEWAPIWAVPLVRRGRAFYCGEDPSDSLPESESSVSKSKRDLWKEVLWHDRKLITPPRQPVLQRLWRRYVEVARNA